MQSRSDGIEPRIIQWLLDTRPLWQVPHSITARDRAQALKAVAPREFLLLSDAEQASVLKYYHLRDAKMSLASQLLKHAAVTKYCKVPWSQSVISRDSKGKPCFVPSSPSIPRIDFNVSHQAGIVSLIAAVGFEGKVDVGTDVVCWNERQQYDYDHIEKNGFFDWVDMHSEVFAETEVHHMKLGLLNLGIDTQGSGEDSVSISRCERRGGSIGVNVHGEHGETRIQIPRDQIIDAKLRRFSAMWCLREAFVKMTGEALLAPWLKELEILDVEAPNPSAGVDNDDLLVEGEVLKDFSIYFKEEKVDDVSMEIRALGLNFMIAGSVRKPGGLKDERTLAMGRWRLLNVEDIFFIANEKQ